MGQEWNIGHDRAIDVGDEGEEVRRLRVTIVSGRVSVVGHDDPTATLEVAGVTGPEVRVAWDGSELVVEQRRPRGILGLQHRAECSATITVALPQGAAVDLSTVDGDLVAAGLRAGCTGQTVNGELLLEDVHGPVAATTVNGRVSGTGTRGDLSVSTVNGRAALSAVVSERVSMSSVNGDLVLDLAEVPGRCEVGTTGVNGTLLVRCPDVPLDVTSSTLGGSVSVDGVTIPRGTSGSPRRFSEPGAVVRVSVSGVAASATVVRPRPGEAPDERVETR